MMIEPAPQDLQALWLVEPVTSTNLPALQLVQAATFEAIEYLPAVHGVHAEAPVPVPVFVIEPALQMVHESTFDCEEN